MVPAYPFISGAVTESSAPPPVVVVPSSTAGPLTLLPPKPFASDIKDKGFGIREETLEEEDDFGKNKGSDVDREGNDDDEDEEEEDEEEEGDEKVPLVVMVVVVEEEEPND